MAFPAWGGAVGNAMMDAAIGYTNALLDKPKEEDEAAERKLKLEELRARIDLNRANAAWLARRQNAAGRTRAPIVKQLPTGEHVILDEDTMGFVPIPGSKARAPRTGNPDWAMKWDLIRMMEDVIGKPRNEWDPGELEHPDIKPLWERFKGLEDWTYVPGIGPVRRSDLRQGAQPGTPSAQPPAGGPAPSAAPSVSPTPAPAPTPDAKTPGPQTSAAPGEIPPQPQDDDLVVKRLKTLWAGKPKEFVQKEIAKLGRDNLTQPIIIASALKAYADLFGGAPPGYTVLGTDTAPGPTAATPGTAPPPPPPTTPPATGGRQAGVVEPIAKSQAQIDAETEKAVEAQRKAEDQQIQRDQLAIQREKLELDKLNAARQQREQEARRQIELTGRVTAEQAAMTALLYSQRAVSQPNYAQLNAREKGLVIRHLMEPKRRKEEREALKLAGPSLDELSALEATMELTELIIPLIESGNLGWLGRGKEWLTWGKNLLGSSAWYNEAEKSLKEEGVTEKITEAMVKARQAAMIAENDPEVQKAMSAIAPQSALQTLSSILAYTHAMAIKRTGAGTARGVIKSDMDEAHKFFDPSRFFASPDQLLTSLYSLQRFIQQARPRLRERVESFHIDPDKRKLMDFQLTLEPLAPGEPLTAPGGVTPEQERLLLEGAQPTPKGP